jgi:outer membrane protein assembly factor BamE (lipoprotein component of BamABCDE complex)
MKKHLIFTVLLLIALLLASCSNGKPTLSPAVAREHQSTALSFYDQITVGMSYDEVDTLIGIPGIRTGMQPTQAAAVTVEGQEPGYAWSFGQDASSLYYLINTDGSGVKSFQWDVSNPAYRKDAVTNQERYEDISTGMSYDQVAAALGSPGRLASAVQVVQASATTEWQTYYWWTSESKADVVVYIVTFENGSMISK